MVTVFENVSVCGSSTTLSSFLLTSSINTNSFLKAVDCVKDSLQIVFLFYFHYRPNFNFFPFFFRLQHLLCHNVSGIAMRLTLFYWQTEKPESRSYRPNQMNFIRMVKFLKDCFSCMVCDFCISTQSALLYLIRVEQ